MTETLNADLEAAITKLNHELSSKMPFVSMKLLEWMKAVGQCDNPADYFRHPRSFPMLHFPRWFAEAKGLMPDTEFQTDLVYSSVCGYFYIRLIDNAMDGETGDERKLLPALGILHWEFTSVYTKYFELTPNPHPFWRNFNKSASISAESTIHDAFLNDVSKDDFIAISSNKMSAAHIPLYAVAHRHHCTHDVAPWIDLVNQTAGWYQMVNDLFDWMNDSNLGVNTYFLSEGKRRKKPNQSLASWVIDDGFDWGVTLLTDQMKDLKQTASALSSPALLTFLEMRYHYFLERSANVQSGFKGLAPLVSALDSQ